MKLYERVTDFHLTPRVPIIGRLDGVAFHTLAKQMKLERPFDEDFSMAMASAAQDLANRVQGFMLAYTQSDEISFLIRTDQSAETTPWFDNRIQKMASVTASIVAASFNKQWPTSVPLAAFDCRVYEVPDLIEAVNYFIWRQNDCTKNSISSAAYFELAKQFGKKTVQKLLHGLNKDERQELLWQKANINWNDYKPEFKRGITVVRQEKEVKTSEGTAIRKPWTIVPAPIFSSDEGRKWIFDIVDPKDKEDDQEKV
jgi:tRNA(His) 5'-end guanylyltransferase